MQKEFALWKCIGYLLLHNKLPQHLAALNSNNFLSSQFYRLAIWARLAQAQLDSYFDICGYCTFVHSQLLAGQPRIGWPKITSLTGPADGSPLGWTMEDTWVPCLLHPVGQARLIHMEIQRGFWMRGRNHARSPEAQTRSWQNVASAAFYWPKQQIV